MFWLIAILGLALLMVVHEGGHFLAARAYGMRVTKFSIGFGPTFFKILPKDGFFWFTTAAEKVRIRLWRHNPEKHGPTVYQVGMIPFLAYVQIAGMNPFEDVDPNDKGSYANASLLGRITAIFAGPLANYLFASVFFFGSLMVGGKPLIEKGKPVLSNEIGLLEDTPAAAAGLTDGDKILQLNGMAIEEWSQITSIIERSAGKPLALVVDREGERLDNMTLTPASRQLDVGDVNGGSRIAIKAKSGPELRWLRDKSRARLEQASAPVQNKAAQGQSADLSHCPDSVQGAHTTINDIDDGVELTITATSEAATNEIRTRSRQLAEALALGKTEEGGRCVVVTEGFAGISAARVQKTPVSAKEAALMSLTMPPQVVKNLVGALGHAIMGKLKVDDLGGPIRMLEEMKQEAKRGLAEYLDMLGGLSAYLGAFNLIPFPMLDGGRLMFLFYEATTRRRANARIEHWIHAFGFLMLVGLMIYVTRNDILRLVLK